MAGISFGAKTEKARRRQRLFFHALFLVLLVHAVLVYTVRDFTMLTRGSVAWLIQGAPGGLASGPKRVTRDHGRVYLWAGQAGDERFDITQFQLDPARLQWGLGREYFPALTAPKFESVAAADEWLDGSRPVLVVKIAEDVRAYPLQVLGVHELVNDMVGDRPIFVAFCPLADLGAAYDRRIDGRTHTFALSGYTYDDPNFWDGREAFVLWDRETESLWWPPIGKAVSGPLNETPMTVLDRELWAQTTWDVIKKNYPNAMILKRGQWSPDIVAQDDSTPSLTTMQVSAMPTGPQPMRPSGPRPHLDAADDGAIAPRWGENPSLSTATQGD
ncbi:MAG: DUF3179 domain-containing (seleno)protein [Phycisphaerales bacterium]